jgi:hypothetical protein
MRGCWICCLLLVGISAVKADSGKVTCTDGLCNGVGPLIEIVRPRHLSVLSAALPIEIDVALHGRGMWRDGAPPLCEGVVNRGK